MWYQVVCTKVWRSYALTTLTSLMLKASVCSHIAPSYHTWRPKGFRAVRNNQTRKPAFVWTVSQTDISGVALSCTREKRDGGNHVGDEREFEKEDQTCLPSQVLRGREGPLSSSPKYDYVKRIKWRRNGALPPTEVTFQRERGHLNTPLSPCRPSAGDGVSLLNDKGKLTFICLHLFPSPPSLLCCIGPLFPFISLYYVLFGLTDLWISSLSRLRWKALGFDVRRWCICVSAPCKTNHFQ